MIDTINSVAVWGDSILKGVITGNDNGKRFELIKENSLALAAEKMGFTLHNESIFGSIISKTQRVLNRDMGKNITADVGIIESGGNDADYDWTQVCVAPREMHTPRTPLPDFLRMLDECVSTLRRNRITPLLMTMPPLVCDRWFKNICIGHDEKTIRDFIGDDIYILYRRHELYSLKITDYAHTHNVQLVDMRMAMLEAPDYRELMCQDGIHPNAVGYAYMATIWEKDLQNIKKEFSQKAA